MNEAISAALGAAVHQLYGMTVVPQLSRPESRFGDVATNVAMQVAGRVKQPPREVAEALATSLRQVPDIADVTVAGPGFLNVRLRDGALAAAWSVHPAQRYAKQAIVTEYSDPNPFKVLHAGHLYTTLVGDSISRLIEAGGGQVHRVNFGGDVGLHVGKTMWGILQHFDDARDEKIALFGINVMADIPLANKATFLSLRYVEGTTAYEEDSAAKTAITEYNRRVYELHAQNDHESDFARVYWMCRQWSYDAFDELYEQLQVTPFEKYYPESLTTPRGVETVTQGLADGVFETSDGAVVYRGEAAGLHTRVFLNSQGLPTYETKDLGLSLHKWNDYHFDRNIIITGNDIIEYMKVVLMALGQVHPEASARTTHLTHGQIKLAGGIKMSSRKGNALQADDVLSAAADAQYAAVGDRDQRVILAAVKYALLKQRLGGDIVYDPVESVSLRGDSGPYLQYAHARACSVVAKCTVAADSLAEPSFDEHERPLAQKLAAYPEVLNSAVQDLTPHTICTYLYELAQVSNRFYEQARVAGDPREVVRLALVMRYRDTLAHGLGMLGIAAPERL
ncbi:MAG TPA: arginine--tRNA ligase [Candidatus Saccharimonadales bacterium]|jgi:arginyl-tRNA synthetase